MGNISEFTFMQFQEEKSQSNKDFIKNCNEDSDIFLKVIFNIYKNCMDLIMICHFYQKTKNKKVEDTKSMSSNGNLNLKIIKIV